MLENSRLLEELRHARRHDARPASSSDVSGLEARLMLADATIMRWRAAFFPRFCCGLSLIVFVCSMRAEMKRDVLQLDTDKVKRLRLLGSGSFADVHESLLEVALLAPL